MKKLSLLLATAALALSSNAADYYLVGGFNGWANGAPECQFTPQSDGTYVFDFGGTLTSGFKVTDGTWADAGTYGGGGVLTVGVEYTLTQPGADIVLEENIEKPHIVFNPSVPSLLITGKQVEAKTGYALHGSWTSATWETVNMTESDGKWSVADVEVTFGTEAASASFGIKEIDVASGSQTGWYASTQAGTVVTTAGGTFTCKKDGTNFSIANGKYSFSYDPATHTLTVTGEGGEVNPPNPPTPPTPGAKDVYLVGECTGWKLDESLKLTQNGNVYTITLPDGITGGPWKLWNGTWDWSFGVGDGQPELGVEYDTWFNSPNFTINTKGETTITFTLVEGSDVAGSTISSKLLVTAGEVVNPPAPGATDVYIVGECTEWKLDESLKLNQSGNVYTITLPDGITGKWKLWNGSWTWNFGAGSEQPELGVEYDTWFDAPDFTLETTGTTTITFTYVEGSDVSNSSISSKLLVKADTNSGVEAVETAEEAVYYNLQGVKVANPVKGIYVKVAGGKASKVVL